MSRDTLRSYIPAGEPVLEIGPLDRPFVQKSTNDVYYADVRGTEEIVDFFRGDPNVNEAQIASIDYVIRTSYREAVGEKRFGAVFHSHVIEHVPNIIRFLRELGEILVDGGKIVMAIPDKRGTFDWFRDVTPFRDAYDVYHGGSPARLAFDHLLNALPTHFRPVSNYIGDVSFRSEALDESRIARAENLYNDPNFIDAASPHYWVFTSSSFLSFLRDGIRCNLLPFRLEYHEEKKMLSNEFYVVLRKDERVIHDEAVRREELNLLIDKIEKIVDVPGALVRELKAYCDGMKKVYIYGAGHYGLQLCDLIRSWGTEIGGFIVSDGHKSADQVKGINVYSLSEINDHRIPIIVALDAANRAAVLPLLSERGFEQLHSLVGL